MARFKTKMGKLPTNEILGVIAGSLAAGIAAKQVEKLFPTLPKEAKSAIPVVLGVFLATQKNAIAKGAGLGMIAKGSSGLAEAFGIGAANVDDLFSMSAFDDMMSAPADQSILSLPADQSILSAMDEDGLGMDELSMMNAYDEEM
jgi:hypothetical protein